MNNSQSSDVFSVSTVFSCNSPKDINNHELLISKTLNCLDETIKNGPAFSTQFSLLLDDCKLCISKNFASVMGLLEETCLPIQKIVQTLEVSVHLLQMLSKYIKGIIESVTMTCFTMKTFPTTTGQLILLVFTHCKDSEINYGMCLNSVEKQLKDLFRACHELQITYLMVLEKHFLFNLTSFDEQDTLNEVLEINLNIGEIVQNLDVKTMAEQWKAVTAICEKYCMHLSNMDINAKSSEILCKMTRNNIQTALEKIKDEKIVIRSLKVASFTIKILSKINNIFKDSPLKNHDELLDMMIFVQTCNILSTAPEKTPQFVNIMKTYVHNPLENLLSELLNNRTFLNNAIDNYDVEKLKDDQSLGYILVIVSIMKILTQKNDQQIDNTKINIVERVYNILPHCRQWLRTPLPLNGGLSAESCCAYGLYEHLLVHTAAFSSCLVGDQYSVLERYLYESILGTDCCKAMFSSDLWVLLSRLDNHSLVLDQVTFLCNTYKKLENHHMFLYSPQRAHLRHTIRRLFESMTNEDKIHVYKEFNVHDNTNMSLWAAINVKNLPNDVRDKVENVMMANCKIQLQKLIKSDIRTPDDINNLIKSMNLAATCSQENVNQAFENLVIQAWTKACNNENRIVTHDGSYRQSIWFLKYIEALITLTASRKYIFCDQSTNLVKVLHSISNIIETGNTELKLLLISLLSKLVISELHDVNKHSADTILVRILKDLISDNSDLVRNKLLMTLKKIAENERIFENVISYDDYLQEAWTSFVENDNTDRKEPKSTLTDSTFIHKCIKVNSDKYMNENNGKYMKENSDKYTEVNSETYMAANSDDCMEVIELTDSEQIKDNNIEKKCSSNFDFADIETLFDVESDSEPDCKKAKLNLDEAEIVITRLEKDTLLLGNIKENVDCYKKRIKNVCEKLMNIIN